jgi:chemotaxis protein MotB
MAGRKKKVEHEEHQNHEAWAIPYGDLVTLLLAFFVVMYAVSSLNEGKYRVLSKSIEAAFNGTPKVIEPIQVGQQPAASTAPSALDLNPVPAPAVQPVALSAPIAVRAPPQGEPQLPGKSERGLERIAKAVERALQNLIDENLVVVRRHQTWLEIEIRTDILFPSGVATLSPQSLPILERLAIILGGFPNEMRIEGYTDNMPIATAVFPSNWELSAARAASVARLFADNGINPHKMAIMGLGEFRPDADNASIDGRNRNRRVKVVVLGDESSQPPSDLIAGSPVQP